MKNFIKKINKIIFLLFFLICFCFFNTSISDKKTIKLKKNNQPTLKQKKEIIGVLKYEWQKVVKLLAERTLILKLMSKTNIKYDDNEQKSFSLTYKKEKDDIKFKYIEQSKDHKNNRVLNVIVSNYKLSGIKFNKPYNFILKGFKDVRELPERVAKLFNDFIFLQKIFKVKIRLFLISKLLLKKKKFLFLRNKVNNFIIGKDNSTYIFKVEENNKNIKKILAFKKLHQSNYTKLTNVSIEIKKITNFSSKIIKIKFNSNIKEENTKFKKLNKKIKLKSILNEELQNKFKLLAEITLINKLISKNTFLNDKNNIFFLPYSNNQDDEINFIYEKQVDNKKEIVILVSSLYYKISKILFLNKFYFKLKLKKQSINTKTKLSNKKNILEIKLNSENQKIIVKKFLFFISTIWNYRIPVDLKLNSFNLAGYIFKVEENNKNIKKILEFKLGSGNFNRINNISIKIKKTKRNQAIITKIIFFNKVVKTKNKKTLIIFLIVISIVIIIFVFIFLKIKR